MAINKELQEIITQYRDKHAPGVKVSFDKNIIKVRRKVGYGSCMSGKVIYKIRNMFSVIGSEWTKPRSGYQWIYLHTREGS